ncbi:hypothetical protein [Agrobacterium rosae]|uniref:Up-regulated in Daf-2 domain-containing protein n=1 Tax=Agrobacterium rosae TaxID=1972867 RepID=A0A1R3T9F2_9HYPH|nr:hypothetical protein [Agrobacterium rosae]SCX05321.1 hypothetical protein DSM25559_0516 [Agrobacterium rosae]
MATKKFTTVRIKNETGVKLASVGIVHKYSDEYNQQKEWLNVPNGTSPDEKLIVEYNTGFLTTGRDWWKIVAMTEDGRIFQSAPNNFRGFIDDVENVLNECGWDIVKLAADITIKTEVGGIVAIPIGVVTAILTGLSNSASTAGFKQFFLENKDVDHGVEIILKANEVEFKAIESTATTPFVSVASVEKKVAA